MAWDGDRERPILKPWIRAMDGDETVRHGYTTVGRWGRANDRRTLAEREAVAPDSAKEKGGLRRPSRLVRGRPRRSRKSV